MKGRDYIKKGLVIGVIIGIIISLIGIIGAELNFLNMGDPPRSGFFNYIIKYLLYLPGLLAMKELEILRLIGVNIIFLNIINELTFGFVLVFNIVLFGLIGIGIGWVANIFMKKH